MQCHYDAQLCSPPMKIWPGSPEIFQRFVAVFQPKFQVLEHCWNRCVLGWSEMREGNGPSDCLRTLVAVHSVCTVKQGLRWMETCLVSPYPCPNSIPSRHVPAALRWPAVQERVSVSSSWKCDSCCLSHHGIWDTCLICQCCQLCKCCSHHSKGLLAFWSPTRIPKYVFLSAASKAQVSQIYFPCKLLLHN